MIGMRAVTHPGVLAPLVILVVAAASMRWTISALGVHLQKLPLEVRRPLAEMPTRSPSWESLVGNTIIESPDVVRQLGTENYVTRRVRKIGASEPTVMDFHAAYYTGMIDTVPHVPERCFVGGGLQQGSSTRTVPIELDLSEHSSFWLESQSSSLLGDRSTPERYRPIRREDGTSDVYWIRRSNEHARGGDQWVRVSFDPGDLRLRVTEFTSDSGVGALFAGYFFIANGGIAPSANQVRQLAFNLDDQYAYYAKVQFTSNQVSSAEELADLAASYLNENLGEILYSLPDWIDVRERQDTGRDPNEGI
ncbi:MAG: hypothetical protein JJU33_08940 [Phycisphaerales bacterium]|nr:hypothetical protein [Phycisphaerales bacterium]